MTSTLLAATDLSPLSLLAVESAARLAPRLGAGRLVVEHVVATTGAIALVPYAVPDAYLGRAFEESLQAAKAQLDALEVAADGLEVVREARLGLSARELIQAARDHAARMVVVASHGHGAMGRALLGSVAQDLARGAPCPVLVVGEGRAVERPFESALAAIDLSPVSRRVLEAALELLGGRGRLHVLSLFEHPMMVQDEGALLPRRFADEDLARATAAHRARVEALLASVPHPGVEVKLEVMSKAPPPQVVLEVAELLAPDVIVCGTSGHGAWHRMILGATATRVLAEARCPVLVVPHDPALEG
jgi:nucleotide-binding universal stress UspA family protein